MIKVNLETYLEADASIRVQRNNDFFLLEESEIEAKIVAEAAALVEAEANRKLKLEAAYHEIVSNSLCNLQSQMAWSMRPHSLTKVAECIAWLDSLWAQYHVDKAAGAHHPTYTPPAPSYSFLETMIPDTNP